MDPRRHGFLVVVVVVVSAPVAVPVPLVTVCPLTTQTNKHKAKIILKIFILISFSQQLRQQRARLLIKQISHTQITRARFLAKASRILASLSSERFLVYPLP